jgi:hypothetical protein
VYTFWQQNEQQQQQLLPELGFVSHVAACSWVCLLLLVVCKPRAHSHSPSLKTDWKRLGCSASIRM